eukprot:scaffold3466_cov80-Attheya_sp.AAC.4
MTILTPSQMLLRRVVQSAFRVSTAARLHLGKEGQTYRRWLLVRTAFPSAVNVGSGLPFLRNGHPDPFLRNAFLKEASRTRRYLICRTNAGPSNLAQYKCVEMYTRPISGAIPLISTLHTAEEILCRRSYSRLREKPSKSQQQEVKLVTMGCASRPFSMSTSPDQDHVSMSNSS